MTEESNQNKDDVTSINDTDIEKIKQKIGNDSSIVEVHGEGLYIPYNDPTFRKFLSSVYSKNSRQLDFVLSHDYFLFKKEHIKNIDQAIISNVYIRDKIDKPDSFIIKLFFRNGDRGEAYFINELEDYETANNEIVKIDINWIYYLRFADRPYPEKQEIYLTIDTNNNLIDPIHGNKKKSNSSDSKKSNKKQSLIKFTINHTEYSWADAIKSEIIKNLEPCIQQIPGWRAFINKYNMLILFSFVVIPMIVGVSLGTEKIDILENQILIDKLTSVPHQNFSTNEKINLIIELIIKEITSSTSTIIPIQYIILFAVLFAVVLLVCLSLIDNLVKPYDRSFILLSNGSNRAKTTYYNRHKNNFKYLILSFTFSIIASIFAAYIDRFFQ